MDIATIAASGSISLVIGLGATFLPAVVGKYMAKELEAIDDIKDPDIRAFAVQGLVLADKKFPMGGTDAMVDMLTAKFVALAPFSGSLKKLFAGLQQTLKADLDAQVKKDAPSA